MPGLGSSTWSPRRWSCWPGGGWTPSRPPPTTPFKTRNNNFTQSIIVTGYVIFTLPYILCNTCFFGLSAQTTLSTSYFNFRTWKNRLWNIFTNVNYIWFELATSSKIIESHKWPIFKSLVTFLTQYLLLFFKCKVFIFWKLINQRWSNVIIECLFVFHFDLN